MALRTIGQLLLIAAGLGLMSAIYASLERDPYVRIVWLGVGVMVAVGVSVDLVLETIAALISPDAERGPAWLRYGLFDGRHAARIQWSAKHRRLEAIAGHVAVAGGASTIFLVPILLVIFEAKRKGWWTLLASYLLVGFLGLSMLSTLLMGVVGVWRLIYLRLRPISIRPGFPVVVPDEPATGGDHDASAS